MISFILSLYGFRSSLLRVAAILAALFLTGCSIVVTTVDVVTVKENTIEDIGIPREVVNIKSDKVSDSL